MSNDVRNANNDTFLEDLSPRDGESLAYASGKSFDKGDGRSLGEEDASKFKGRTSYGIVAKQFSIHDDESHLLLWFASIPQIPQDTTDATSTQSHSSTTSDRYRGFSIDWDKIENILTDMHSYCMASRFKKYREYRECPSGTLNDINSTLKQCYDQLKSLPSSKTSKHQQRAGRRLMHFVLIAQQFFRLYLPLRYTSEMLSKYWGAIHCLLQVCRSDDQERVFAKQNKGRATSERVLELTQIKRWLPD